MKLKILNQIFENSLVSISILYLNYFALEPIAPVNVLTNRELLRLEGRPIGDSRAAYIENWAESIACCARVSWNVSRMQLYILNPLYCTTQNMKRAAGVYYAKQNSIAAICA